MKRIQSLGFGAAIAAIALLPAPSRAPGAGAEPETSSSRATLIAADLAKQFTQAATRIGVTLGVRHIRLTRPPRLWSVGSWLVRLASTKRAPCFTSRRARSSCAAMS